MSTSSETLSELNRFYEEHEKAILKDFMTFLRFPSVSSEPSFKEPLRACAAWLKNYLEEIPMDVQLWETIGHPVLFACYDKAGPDKPTVLIYNHYDVQPSDPEELWQTPAFEPTVRDGQIYARGAQDNKGQCFYVIQAIRALMQRDGKLPVNLKLVIEGEEECGSAGLASILVTKASDLKADYLLIVDVGIKDLSSPAVTLGVRGIVTMDVECRGSKSDLHSGIHGGIVFNPIHGLIEILGRLRDPSTGRINVPGFYDDVKDLTESERNELGFDFDSQQYEKDFGAHPTGGERQLTPLERAWLRPTIEINGVTGGYSGLGFKTVIPAVASAKVSVRLVPNQVPELIAQKVAQFIKKQAPLGIEVKVHVHLGGGPAIRVSPKSNVANALAKAYEDVFNKPCAFILDGGSIPIVTKLQKASGGDVLLVGLGLPDDQIHAPNEHFGIDRLHKGCLLIARSLELLAQPK